MSVSLAPTGATFGRYVSIAATSQGSPALAAKMAEIKYPGSPAIAATFNRKTAIDSGTVADPGWGGRFVEYGIDRDFAAPLRDYEVISRLAPRRVPFNVSVPILTADSGAGAAWIAEGVPIPASSATFGSASLPILKSGDIVVLTQELVRSADPSAPVQIAQASAASVASFFDRQFLDPTNAADAGVNPGSVTSAGTEAHPTGSTAAHIQADFASMIEAAGDMQRPCWIMSWANYARASVALGVPGQSPGAGFFGAPVIISRSVQALGSPTESIIALLDQEALLLAGGELAEVDVSRHATIQQSDAPSGGTTSLVSLYQANSVAVRILRSINWALTRATGCIYMSAPY